MKNKFYFIGLTILLVFLSFTCLTAQNFTDHYFYGAERVNLQFEDSRLLVKFEENITKTEQQKVLSKYPEIRIQELQKLPSPDVTFVILQTPLLKSEMADLLLKLGQDINIKYARPFFSYDGVYQTTTNELVVKLKKTSDYNQLQQFAAATEVTIREENQFIAGVYILEVPANKDVLSVANILHNSNVFEYAEPNFLRLMQKMTNDPYFSNQWSLENLGTSTIQNGVFDADMDVTEAWNNTTGANIKVAVLDDGVDLNHPDLINNLLPGYDGTGQGSAGHPSNNDAHGTACAGIIGAEANNNIGLAGVAYDCQIIPIRIAYNVGGSWLTYNTWVSNSINWAWQTAQADVMSNSWGGGSPSSMITNAFNDAISLGRNGLGTPVLVATGNDNTTLAYPASLPNVISVGAMSMCNERKNPNSCDGEPWGSNYGTGLDVMAPGTKIVATDISGSAGYVSGDYTTTFNGTSSATPNTAGVMALILSANPFLTSTEARAILESTCEKVGGYAYAANATYPNGTWHNEMGYGRVNADLAVQAALAVLPAYCFPSYTNTCTNGSYIDSLAFHTITNGSTGCANPDTSNFSDYTNLVANVYQGEEYQLSVTSGTNGQYMVGFIDFNQDKDFDDVGEFFDIGFVAANSTLQTAVTIPFDAKLDLTTLRVMSRLGNSALSQSDVCVSGLSEGEVEDYSVVVMPSLPSIAAMPDSFLVVLIENQTASESLIITNIGDSTNLNYNITLDNSNSWFSINSTTGILNPNQSDTIALDFSSVGLVTGIYMVNLTIQANVADSTILVIPCRLEVIDTVTTNFEASKTYACDGVVVFQDLSANVPNTWLWDFGDGTIDTVQNPQHIYQTNGFYDVSLIACNALGCDTLLKVNYIEANLTSVFCDTLTMTLSDTIFTSNCSGVIVDDGGVNGNYSDNQQNYLEIDVTDGDGVRLVFDDFKVNNNDYLNIVRTYDDGNTTSTSYYYNYTQPTFLEYGGNTDKVFLRFFSNSSGNNRGFVIRWQCIDSLCVPGNSLSVSNLDIHSATLNWDNLGVNGYHVRWRTFEGEFPTNWKEAETANNFLNLTDLIGGKKYEWQVRSNCDTLGTGAWSVRDTFRTLTGFEALPSTIHFLLQSGDTATNTLTLSNLIQNHLHYDASVLDVIPTLNENFENGNISNWNMSNLNSYSIDSIPEVSNNTYFRFDDDGYIWRQHPYFNKNYISFNVFTGELGNGQDLNVIFRNSGIIYFQFNVINNNGRKLEFKGQERPYLDNTWYHVEFRNINFQTGYFDYYLNGELVAANLWANLYSTVLSRVYVYNSDPNSNVGIDNILMGQTFESNEFSWLNIVENDNQLTVNDTDSILININTTGLTIGTYQQNITIRTNNPDSSIVQIPVILEVVDTLLIAFEADSLWTCDGIVNFTDLTRNYPKTWLWDFGDGHVDTIQHPQHIYRYPGNYNISLITCNEIGCDTLLKTQYIEVVSLCDTFLIDNSNATTTRCTGKLYDDGGPNANYTTNGIHGDVLIEVPNTFRILLITDTLKLDNSDQVNIKDGNNVYVSSLAVFEDIRYVNRVTSSDSAILVRFHRYSGLTSELGFDMTWKCTSELCDIPTNLSQSAVSPTTATVTWNSKPYTDDYDIQWRPAGFTTGWNELSTTADSVVFTNLLGGKSYEWRVRNHCLVGGISDWSETGIFTTLESFDIQPDSIEVTLLTGDSTIQNITVNHSMASSSYTVTNPNMDILYAEDFESNNYKNSLLEDVYTAVGFSTPTNVGTNTSHSLEVDGFATAGHYYSGVHHNFGENTPDYISFDFYPNVVNLGHGYISLRSTNNSISNYPNDVISLICTGYGMEANGAFAPYNANQWYHIEFRNIDFNTQTFDFYVDNVLKQAGVAFDANDATVDEIRIGNTTFNASMAIDNIIIGKTNQDTSATANSWLITNNTIIGSTVDSIPIKIDATGLATGTYNTSVLINAPSPHTTAENIPITLHVVDKPKNDFEADKTYSCDGIIQFTDLTVNAPESWYWNFGDGTLDSTQNPLHIYQNSGMYDVSLITCNAFGCDTLTRQQYIDINIGGGFCDTLLMPADFSTVYTNNCSGILYDNGGPNGDYSNASLGVVVIEPTGASQVILHINSFNLASGENLRIYDNNGDWGTLLANLYSTSTIPSVVMSSGDAITLRFSTSNTTTASGFEIAWQCVDSACVSPINLTTTNIDAGSATVHWDSIPESLGYDIRWRKVGTQTWSTNNTLSDSLPINNLTSLTTYEWQVQSNCTFGGKSSWSVTDTFVTSEVFNINPDTLYITIPKGTTTVIPVAVENITNSSINYLLTAEEDEGIFKEGFEDNTYNSLMISAPNTLNYTTETILGGIGTYSLKMTGSASTDEFLHKDFSPATPDYLSFRIKPGNGSVDGLVRLGEANYPSFSSFGIFYFRCSTSLGMGVGNNAVTYTPGQWYHIEFRNIDYINQTFSYYVNGTLIAQNINFIDNSSTVDRLEITKIGGSTSTYIDDIVLGNYSELVPDWLSVQNVLNSNTQAIDTVNININAIASMPAADYRGEVYFNSMNVVSTRILPVYLSIIDSVDIDFTDNVTNFSCDGIVDFTNLSTGNVDLWHWNFGDGNTSTLENPTYAYTSSGTYDVTLIGCNNISCDTLTKHQFVDVILNGPYCDTLYLPTDGSTITATSCTGVFYDDGGPNGNYTFNSSGLLTIAPTGATNVILTFDNVSLGSGELIRVYDGNSINAPLIGSYTGTNTPTPIISNGNTLTVYFTTNHLWGGAGFGATWYCLDSMTCTASTVFSTNNITQTSAELSWDAGINVAHYEVRIREQGTTIWLNDTVMTTNFIVNNLTNYTNYEWQMRTLCISNYYSNWSSSEFFQTTYYPLSDNIISNNLTCFGANNGTIDLNISGGVLPYIYNWNNGFTSDSIFNLTVGNYTCTVTDAVGQTLNINVPIIQPIFFTLSEVKTDATCYGGNDGMIDITVNGGTSPYTYNWSNGKITEDIDSLSAGTYNCIITDSNGCDTSLSMTITEPTPITVSDTILTNDNGTGDGSVQITVTGGVTPYSFNWNNGSQTQNIDSLTVGNYIVTITDALGCQSTFAFDILVSTFTIKNDFNINYYPNPVQKGELLNLMIPIMNNDIEYRLNNMLGQVISHGRLKANSEFHNIQMPNQNGVYNITLYDKDNNILASIRIIVN